MRNIYPALIAFIGLLAVGATLWVLFSDEGEQEGLPFDSQDARDESGLDSGTEKPAHTNPEEETGKNALEVSNADKIKEKVLPDYPRGEVHAGLKIQVLHRSGEKPVSPQTLDLKVYYYDHPLSQSPAYVKSTGEYVLDDLLPGHYKALARTRDWSSGSASALVEVGGFTYMTVLVDQPSHLQVQVVDGVSGEPVHNAKLEIPGFIDGGLTDDQGVFKSARKWTPDSELVLRISHPSYFTTLFEPLHPEKSGTKKIGKIPNYRVPLTPRKGDLVFSGELKDDLGAPLPRWTLFLGRENESPSGEMNRLTQVSTDSRGAFRFSGLRPGAYRVMGTIQLLGTSRIAHPPVLFQETVNLAPGQSVEGYTLVCPREKQPFCGRVLRTETRKPAQGLHIAYRHSRGRFNRDEKDKLYFQTVRTDANGAFCTSEAFLPEDIFRILLTGSLEITNQRGEAMHHRPMQSYADIRQLQADIVRRVPLILWTTEQGDVKLVGHILDAGGTPMAQVRVSAFSGTGVFQGHHRGFTDVSGKFEIPRLYPGEWLVKASLPRGPSLEETVSIPPNRAVAEITMKVKDTCRLEGEIKTDQIPDRMTIRVKGLNFETQIMPIGSDLWYTFQHLPEGKAQVILEVYAGKRFYESNLKVVEDWVDLKPGRVVRKDFIF